MCNCALRQFALRPHGQHSFGTVEYIDIQQISLSYCAVLLADLDLFCSRGIVKEI